MLKRLSFFLLLAAIGAALASAQQSTVQIPIKGTRANDGKQMFVNYCAPCHGVDARGHGPMAAVLKTPPVDLTAITRNNHGTYPATHVTTVLKFGVQKASHGTSQMPVWGPVLTNLDHPDGTTPNLETLRVNNLVRYIETLQTK